MGHHTDAALRQQAALTAAGILARGYDEHVRAHGPDGNFAVRTDDGSKYDTAPVLSGGAVSFIVIDGEVYAVNVVPLGLTGPAAGSPRRLLGEAGMAIDLLAEPPAGFDANQCGNC